MASRFIITGFLFFLVGGVLALLMRTQLIVPDNELLTPEFYNQLFTMHGTVTMFVFAVPIMEAFGAYLVPSMMGTRDLAFPRLTAYSYWCYLSGGLLLLSSFLVGAAPDGGWFMYVPLTSRESRSASTRTSGCSGSPSSRSPASPARSSWSSPS